MEIHRGLGATAARAHRRRRPRHGRYGVRRTRPGARTRARPAGVAVVLDRAARRTGPARQHDPAPRGHGLRRRRQGARNRLGAARARPPRAYYVRRFGTILDWRTGLTADVARAGGPVLDEALFEAVIDAQARDEQAEFRPYAEITARSLVTVLGSSRPPRGRLARPPDAGRCIRRRPPPWPGCFGRAVRPRRRTATVRTGTGRTAARIRAHALDLRGGSGRVQARPPHLARGRRTRQDPPRARLVARLRIRRLRSFDRATLGLTCVYVARPHARAGTPDLVDLEVADLAGLAAHPELAPA